MILMQQCNSLKVPLRFSHVTFSTAYRLQQISLSLSLPISLSIHSDKHKYHMQHPQKSTSKVPGKFTHTCTLRGYFRKQFFNRFFRSAPRVREVRCAFYQATFVPVCSSITFPLHFPRCRSPSTGDSFSAINHEQGRKREKAARGIDIQRSDLRD